MVRGEEKQFEITVDRLIEYTRNIQISLSYFMHRISQDNGSLDWPQALDTFVSICGQINTLMRFKRENRSQLIENRVILPIRISPDIDEELLKLTDGRVPVVNDKMVPNYLRTKPDPEIEEFEKNLQAKASTINSDAAVKQTNAMTKLVDNILNTIKTNSTRTDTEMSRQAIKASFAVGDTNELIMAVSTGRGLSTGMQHRVVQIDAPVSQRIEPTSRQGSQKQNVKAPELKTNIKAGP